VIGAEEVRALKRAPGKDIVIWGSITLASFLLNERLIDEIQLRVVPTALGSGRQLFEEAVRTDLNLIEAQPHDGGLGASAVPAGTHLGGLVVSQHRFNDAARRRRCHRAGIALGEGDESFPKRPAAGSRPCRRVG